MAGGDPLFLGIDAGTSGIRGQCIDGRENIVATAEISFSSVDEARSTGAWKAGVFRVLQDLSGEIALDRIRGVAVDGQSGTVLLCDDDGTALTPPMFYNESPSDGQVPPTLGRVMDLWADHKAGKFCIVHQADWLAGLLCGRFDFSDENNALKLGYDPFVADWGFDPAALPFDPAALPTVFPPATPVGKISQPVAAETGLSPDCQVFAGTTDGMAGFIAASGLGNLEPGTAVTSLGTTLVIKAISETRIDVAEFGIYSHKLFDQWLAGGASNTGGGALLRHFSGPEMTTLSKQIDPETPTGLDYYPLTSSGERFPVADPELKDHTEPRPENPALFLAGLFESIARIEKRGYELLREYGVPYPTLVKTVGGGSRNKVWLKIRQRILGAEVIAAAETEASFGAALIALRGHSAS